MESNGHGDRPATGGRLRRENRPRTDPEEAVMNCVHCSAEIANIESSFCHKCGKPIVTSVGGSVQHLPPVKISSFTWVFWLLLFIAFSSWVGFFLPIFAGHEVSRQIVLPVVVWTGGLFAYVWKKRKDKGWQGFAIGVLIAIAVMTLVGFAVTYLRAEAVLHETMQKGSTESPMKQ